MGMNHLTAITVGSRFWRGATLATIIGLLIQIPLWYWVLKWWGVI